MAKSINPGSLWLDLRPSDPDRRRVVRVESVDQTYVEAVGWWEQYGQGEQADRPGLRVRRKTRVLRAKFVKQYAELGPLVDVGAIHADV